MNANVTLLTNGQAASTETVELMQNSNSAIFEGHVTLPGPIGQVHIQIVAVYLQIPVEASEAQVTIPLKKPVVNTILPKPPSCGTIACYIQRYPALLALPFIFLLLLLLLLLLIWRGKTGPSGSLTQGTLVEELTNVRRAFFSRLFNKSTLTSQELEGAGFSFGEAAFNVVSSSGGWQKVSRRYKCISPFFPCTKEESRDCTVPFRLVLPRLPC